MRGWRDAALMHTRRGEPGHAPWDRAVSTYLLPNAVRESPEWAPWKQQVDPQLPRGGGSEGVWSGPGYVLGLVSSDGHP